MTYITKLTARRKRSVVHMLAMVLTGFVLVLLQSSTAHAQWAPNGNNINNTNSGNVGIGTASPGDKLVTVGNIVGGNITSHTQTYPGFDAQANVVMELGYGTATANIVPYPALVLSKNLTSTSNVLGLIQFANRSIADGSEKRIAQIAGWTDGATNSGGLGFATTNAGMINERMRISAAGNVGIGTTAPIAKLHINAADDTVAPALSIRQDTAPLYGFDFTLDTNVNGNLSLNRVNNGTSTNVITLDRAGGNVGLGTTTPTSTLDIRAASAGISTTSTTGTNRVYVGAVNTGGSVLMGSESSVGQSIFNTGTLPYAGVFGTTQARAVQFVTNQTARITIDASGNVGIGTPTPSKKLDVNGDLNASGTITGGTIQAKYQDVAEWVQSSQTLEGGTVVVLDQTRSNQVIASSQAYDTRVAGVISLQPGIALGEQGAGKLLVATTGRVKVKVDASSGPIKVGDLLVTGDKEGVATKSEPLNLGGVQLHRPGTLIGKALEPLLTGTGEILVLLSLQ